MKEVLESYSFLDVEKYFRVRFLRKKRCDQRSLPWCPLLMATLIRAQATVGSASAEGAVDGPGEGAALVHNVE